MRRSPRRIALDVLVEVEGKSLALDRLMERAFERNKGLTQVDYAFIREVVYGTLRWRGRIDWIIGRISRLRPERLERLVLNVLRMGVYQILFMDRVPVSAAVNESVEMAKVSKGAAAGFINAILRGISDGRANTELPHSKDVSSISIRLSHPLWLVERWVQELGTDETIDLCKANNRIPPISLRTNTLRTSRAKLLGEVRREVSHAIPSPFSPEGILIDPPVPLSRIPGFGEGWFQVQDESSQLVGYIVDPRPGDRVLDGCAAPGGKTTHLAQLMGNRGRIYAADLSARRLLLLKENCRRLGISIITPLVRDLARPGVFEDGGEFDRILVDPPCSGLGTLWRNPDIKWRRSEEEIPTFREIQLAMVRHVAPRLKKGGSLVYGTCTLTREENEEVVEKFIAEHGGFEVEDLRRFVPKGLRPLIGEDGFFRSLPHCHGMDGFFAARFKRVRG